MQKKVARESFLHHGPKKHECKKCRKIVTSDSVERWASHLRSCANVCSETKSLLPTAKDSCRPSVIVIDGSTQPNGCLPAYKVPSRKLLATRLLDNAFEKQKTVIGECRVD